MAVAVIGGGELGSGGCNRHDEDCLAPIYLISITPLTGDHILKEKVLQAENITVLTDHQTTEIVGDGSVSAVRLTDLKTGEERRLEVSGVFVEIGLIPNSDFVRGIADSQRVRRDTGRLCVRNGSSRSVRCRRRHKRTGKTDRRRRRGRGQGYPSGAEVPPEMRLGSGSRTGRMGSGRLVPDDRDRELPIDPLHFADYSFGQMTTWKEPFFEAKKGVKNGGSPKIA